MRYLLDIGGQEAYNAKVRMNMASLFKLMKGINTYGKSLGGKSSRRHGFGAGHR
jgi:hypothetical protein